MAVIEWTDDLTISKTCPNCSAVTLARMHRYDEEITQRCSEMKMEGISSLAKRTHDEGEDDLLCWGV
jgi:hypothetical protein